VTQPNRGGGTESAIGYQNWKWLKEEGGLRKGTAGGAASQRGKKKQRGEKRLNFH